MGFKQTFLGVLSSFFGGLTFTRHICPDVTSTIFYVIFILFFELYFYLDTQRNAKLIGCAVLTGVVFIIKLVLYIFHLMLNTAMDLSVSEPSVKEERPDDIPPEIWETRMLLKDPKPNLDSVVSDLIASGIDADGLIRLVNYLQDTPDSPVEEVSSEKDANPVINICGRLHTLPFTRHSIERVFPTNFSFFVLIFALVFGFSSSYLPLSLSDQFRNREKWWLAIECGFSIFSILKPPDNEPYLTFSPDSWTCLARPLSITLMCSIWRVCLDESENGGVSRFPFYGWKIDWNPVFPYVYEILRYGLLLMPFWLLFGFLGHPVATIVSVLESACRYLFGQNGVKNVLHLIVQLLRGSASVAICWAILRENRKELFLSVCITVSSFLGSLPLYVKKGQMIHPLVSFLYPFLAATSFISSFCLCFLLVDGGDEDKKLKIVLYFALAWFLLFEVVMPFLMSAHRYWIFHTRVIKMIPGFSIVRGLSQLFVGPIFLSACLKNCSFHPLLIAFIIVHSTQKYCTEPHVFAFAAFLTVLTLPFDFDLKNNYSANLLVSLLVASKIEIFLPQLRLVYRSKYLYQMFDFRNNEPLSILGTIVLPLYHSLPLNDFVLKIPSLIWSFITGASFTAIRGLPYFLAPAPPRPFYFFDWPSNIKSTPQKESFAKSITEHPIETTVFTSLARELSREFANIVRSGRLGFVTNGDVFLFMSKTLVALVHVISSEPNLIRIQIRGHKFDDQVDESECGVLEEALNNYQPFFHLNFEFSFLASNTVYDIRAHSIQLNMYEVSTTKLDSIFSGIDSRNVYELFLASFCFVISDKKEKLFEVRPISPEDSNSVQNFNTPELRTKIAEYISLRFQNFVRSEENGSHEFGEEEENLAVNLWLAIALTLFNSENFSIKSEIIVNCFKGNIPFSERQVWVYNSPTLLVEVIIPSIQLGCAASYFAGSGSGPDFEGDESSSLIMNFIESLKKSIVFKPLESNVFQKTFLNENGKEIVAFDSIKKEDVVIRFSLGKKNWAVLQIDHEWLRALWSNDERDLLFYKFNERSSTEMNNAYLNNMILQTADAPVGNPAFTSEILDSYTNPFSTDLSVYLE